MKPKRVLAVGAHPFDVEVLCGGTLLRLRSAGAEIAIAILTDGAAGNALMPIPREQLAAQRHEHAQASAKKLGASLHWLGVQDGLLMSSAELRLQLINIVREVQPDLTFVHRCDDYHPDNRQAGLIALEACLLAPLANLKTKQPPIKKVPAVYELDSWISAGREGVEFVDISEVLKQKNELVGHNELGVNWLRKFDNVSLFELVEENARARGFQCGTKYAESFKLSAKMPTALTQRLLP